MANVRSVDYEAGEWLAMKSEVTIPLTGYRLEGTQEYRDFLAGWQEGKRLKALEETNLTNEGKQ